MMREFNMTGLPNGVTGTNGMCGLVRNKFQTYPQPAYTISENTILTVGTDKVRSKKLFKLPIEEIQNSLLEGFPKWFS